ncbi:hypothetical protein [Campylobacter troglodytis]|uniref:hypothetical protein n=1 Tax=Campylobacter troglodytis TaxID=654363 RepID=UPI003D003A5A
MRSLTNARFKAIPSKPTVPWWIFCFILLATWQEGAKAHYRVMQMSLQRGETTLTKF